MTLLPKLVDDRGQPCRAVSSPFNLFGARKQDLSRSQVRKIETRGLLYRGAQDIAPMLLAFIFASPFFILAGISIALLTRNAWTLALAPFLGIAGPLALAVSLRAFFRDRIARTYPMAGRCGACAFPLEGLEPEGDGCTVCPECGAAWQTPSRPDTASSAR